MCHVITRMPGLDRRRLVTLTALAAAGLLGAPAGALAAEATAEQLTIHAAVPSADYEINRTEAGDRIEMDGFGVRLTPGEPVLPARIFAIAIPPGAEPIGVTFTSDDPIVLPGSYDVPPASLPQVIGEENPDVSARERAMYERNYNTVYGSDEVYPPTVAELIRTAGYRTYDLVDVRVAPFAYHPLSGRLMYYPNITVQVQCAMPDRPVTAARENLPRVARNAEEIILNDKAIERWYEPGATGGRSLHDFVIITLDSLTSRIGDLVAWETGKGRTVEVVTTAWINSNYSGYDLAEKVRNFLREKYPADQWGIEDVLLIGHYDDVPMRRTAQNMGYGEPETDYYYGELSLPDSESWDADGDHRWGEDSDPIDFYAEVNVGRIPWSDGDTVEHICAKSVAYEQNQDPSFKKNILLLGAFFWPDTDNAVLMERKVDEEWMADWTMTRMYEEGYSGYSMDYNLRWSNVRDVWSSGKFAFVNWAGHGSPTSSHIYYSTGEAFADNSTCNYLNDEYPSIIFADACSNSDTDHLNIGQAMLRQGGVGFLGATKVAYGMHDWNNPNSGSSQSLDYFFTTCVTSGEYTQGAAHQWGLREMYTRGLWYYVKYETFEWGALWGNPNLAMAAPPAMTFDFPEGLPEYLDPGEETTIPVRIVNGTENYVPGTGTLHCRYDGGSYVPSALVHVEGDQYEATLPAADCDDVPEFYFSAETDGGSTVYSPYGAPDNVYTATVGTLITIMHDDFETDQGWSVSGDAADGQWERGVPVGGGDRGDPPNDYDGSGQCYLTDNEDGNSDVDDGYTYLTSPTIDLSDCDDAEISYALWYTNNNGQDPNNDLFKTYVSNNGGADWVVTEIVGPASSAGWHVYAFSVSDFVDPTDQIRVMFEASDLNQGSVVEAGIDAFFVTRFECEGGCPGDFDGDGDIDTADLLFLLAAWGTGDGDMDGDGDTDTADLLALLAAWGDCP